MASTVNPNRPVARRETMVERAARETAEKVDRLVTTRFGGDYGRAYDAYADTPDHCASREAVKRLLKDANVGGILRGKYVDGLMERFDTSPRDGKVSRDEFERGLREIRRNGR